MRDRKRASTTDVRRPEANAVGKPPLEGETQFLLIGEKIATDDEVGAAFQHRNNTCCRDLRTTLQRKAA